MPSADGLVAEVEEDDCFGVLEPLAAGDFLPEELDLVVVSEAGEHSYHLDTLQDDQMVQKALTFTGLLAFCDLTITLVFDTILLEVGIFEVFFQGSSKRYGCL